MDEKKTVFSTILNPNVYKFDFKNGSRKHLSEKTNETGMHTNIINKILYTSQNEEIDFFIPISMADIDKILNVKLKIKFNTIIHEQYWDYLDVFNED